MNCASMNSEKSRLSAENARLRRALKQIRDSRRRVEEELRRERRRVKEVEKAYEEERQKSEEIEKKLAEIERQRDRYRDMVFKPKVVRYNTEVQWCPQCKKVVRGRANGVIPRCRLGVNVLLYVLIHKYISRESWETLVNNLSNWYGLKVSKGNLIGMMHRARNWLGYKYDDILEQIRSANIKYADETSWRVNGMNNWLWGFFTDQYAYYTIEESRGKGIAEKILKGSHPEDVLVRDDYGGYMKLNSYPGGA